ncbi:MAG: peroxide stress protein YaaA [Crocinitomicaceae bacterium]|nr:peroxide stress protein YaaA [Crocinitomicaceae bacterium]
MRVLLSPAKALDMDKEINATSATAPIFMEKTESLAKKLSKFSSRKIGKMMHLSKDLSDLNHERYQTWTSDSELNGNNTYAIAAFNGEVYRGFDAPSLSKEKLMEAQGKVRILSGLYGILKPLDVIYPYRLEMGTKWAVTPKTTSLYKFWGSKIADALNEENEDGIIVNLASTEYFKAVDKKALKGRIITPSFKDLKNGEYKTIMVFAKRARGSMARYIVDHSISNPEEIKGFDTDGYRYDENLSTEDDWVFTR